MQTVRPLDTLINIVRGGRPAARRLERRRAARMRRGGLHSLAWAWQDRDNQAGVYLYFCPEDMTVALGNVQGIGWQGVPDQPDGRPRLRRLGPRAAAQPPPARRPDWSERKPLQELGPFPAGVHPKMREWAAKQPLRLASRPAIFILSPGGRNDRAHGRRRLPPAYA